MAVLTDTKLRALKPRPAVYRVADMLGLAIEVRPTGTKQWRYRFRFNGKASMMTLGTYPAMSLQDARTARDEARRVVARGEDPVQARKTAKLLASMANATTFEPVAREWMATQQWTPRTRAKAVWTFETYVFPYIGERPVAKITAHEVLAVCRRPEQLGKVETAQRVKQRCSAVFRYAVSTLRADADPTAVLRGALKTVRVVHHASVTDKRRVGQLMRDIYAFEGHMVTQCALKLSALVWARPVEIRHWEWSEISEDGSEWRIPAHKMKMGYPHIVPLSSQAQEVIAELRSRTGRGKYLFPAHRGKATVISENTINAALRRLDYDTTEMTAHGFRSMASTILNEDGFNGDWVERQLSHCEKDGSRAAYNYAQYLPSRREMMQAWADLLDRLRIGGNVVEFTPRAAGHAPR